MAQGSKWEICENNTPRTITADDFNADGQVDVDFSLIRHPDEEEGLSSVIIDDLTTTVATSTITVCDSTGTCGTYSGALADKQGFSWAQFDALKPRHGETYTYACSINLADGSTLTCPETSFTVDDPVYVTLSSGAQGHQVATEIESTRADLNDDGVVNGNDLTLLMDQDVYQTSTEGDVNGDGVTNALDYTLLIKWFGHGAT